AVVLEVKGSGVAWGPDGWTVMRAQHQVRADPVDQARTAMYALRNLVEHDARWGGRERIRWAHAVVTPFTRFGPDFALPDLPRWMLHDKNDQRSLAQRLAEQLDRTEHADARRPHEGDLEMVVEILTRPPRDSGRPARGVRRARCGRRPADDGAGRAARRDAAAAPGRGARRGRQRQDRAGAAAGQGPQPRRRGPLARARGAAVLLDRARRAPHARGLDVGVEGAAGVRRHLPRLRQAVGCADRLPHR